MTWNLAERTAVEKLLSNTHDPLLLALAKFFDARAGEHNAICAEAMRSDPPMFHRAVQYASRAQLYEEILQDLAHECDKEAAA